MWLTFLYPSNIVTTKTQTICPAIHRAKSVIGGYVPSTTFQKNSTRLVRTSSTGAKPVYTVRTACEGDADSCPITSKVPLNACRPIIVNAAGKTKLAMSQGAQSERNMAMLCEILVAASMFSRIRMLLILRGEKISI